MLVASGLFWSTEAHSQTTTDTIKLDTAHISRLYYRTNKARSWWVSYADCLADDVFSFPLTLSNFGNTLEVWEGNQDCSSIRGSIDRGQCRLLATKVPDDRTLRVDVPVRNIVGQKANTLDLPDGGFGPEVCDESTDAAGTKFTLYFLQTNGGSTTANTNWNGGPDGFGFDMVGPAPPGTISIGMGEQQLSIEVGDVKVDTDRDRFAAYCVDLTPDDFIPADGASLACSTSELVSGERPPLNRACGSATQTSGAISTDSNLVNDHVYAIGVSAQDILGNAGPLSEVKCGTPKPLDDFFELYSEAGGPGGGGFCNVSPGAPRSAPGAALLLGLALAALRARRAGSRA